jgi:hypothetical protein
MAPYLAAVRNYWALLPAIAVIVVLILVYAIPTLINPQWTSSIMALFRQHPVDPQATTEEARREAGFLGPQQVKSRRMLAVALVAGALALIGFNVSLNREANGCYTAAKAFGAVDAPEDTKDPCINMIYGSFFGDGSGKSFEETQQPVPSYQLVEKKKPKYLKWIQNSPGYDVDLLVGTGLSCNLDLKVEEADDKITVLVDSNAPCPPESNVSLTAIKLKKPLGDRKIVTVDDKPMQEINPDMDSWPTVLKKLVTGG